jgi:general secretion pathway protein K
MSARSRQSGIALVLVMWVSILIAVIASAFIEERHSEALVVRNSISMARASAAADAGVQRALLDAFRGDTTPGVWKRDGQAHDWVFDGIPVRVEMRDESAKIDINTAAEPLLKGMLLSVGLQDDEATRLLDAILDWRDADSLKRPNGAEEPEYRAAGLSYGPANAPFEAIEELQLVLGMTPEIYRRIAPMITVYSKQPGVNTTVASRDVLLAIPGVTPDIVDDFLRRRADAAANNQPLPALIQGAAYSAGASMVTNVRAEARLDDGTYFAREAVALLRSLPKRPMAFVVWRESTAPREDDQAQGLPGQPPGAPAQPGQPAQPQPGGNL